MISNEAIEELQRYLRPMMDNFSPMKQLRDRYELIDKYVAKESMRHADALQGKQVNRAGNKTVHQDIEIPLCHIYAETAKAFYASIFLSGFPIFGTVASRKNEDAAAMLQTLCGRDQIRFNWVRNLLQSLGDGVKYNIMATEVSWESKRAISAVNAPKLASGQAHTGSTKSVVYSGNKLKRLNPYNTFWDTSVPISECHETGSFAGYIERYNYVQLKQYVQNMDDTYLVRRNINAIFKSQLTQENYFYTPSIREIGQITTNTSDWGAFFNNDAGRKSAGGGKYEMVTAYLRIVPKDFRISVPRAGEVQVFKAVWVNGYLAYLEPITAGHEYLPIIITALNDDGTGLEAKSPTEFIMDNQDLSTSIIIATINSMRRAVADRGLYNPNRIKAADINSPHPTAKIPVRFTAYDEDFSKAYQQLPFTDTVSASFKDNLNLVFSITDQTTGANRAQQGAFQKGNKTLHEYDDVMKNSQGRLLLNAMGIEASHYVPIKQILKLNYFVYAVNEAIFDPQTRNMIDVDPQKLRELEGDFQMSDGLMPNSKLANSETTQGAIGLFGQFPALDMEYDVGGMVISVLKQQGMKGLEDYKRTPDQRKQKMEEMQTAIAAKQAGALPPTNPAAGG